MSGWLFRCALWLVPASWRDAVRRDIEDEAQASLGTRRAESLWAARETIGIAVRLRATISGDSMMSDGTFAFHQLRHAPAFTIAAILTLAIGIGLNISVFAVADGILFKPLPYRDPARLVLIQGWDAASRTVFSAVPINLVNAAIAGTATVEAIAVSPSNGGRSIQLIDPAATPLRAYVVSTNGLDVLGITPFLGRAFVPGDETAEPRPVLLSHAAWQQRFGGDRSVVGRALPAVGRSFVIAGVLPPFVPLPGSRVVTSYDLLLPAPLPGRPGSPPLAPFARLRPGATVQAANDELNALSLATTEAGGGPSKGAVRVSGLRFGITESRRPAMVTLVVVASLVLLIAMANLANLFLSRGTSRATELGVRTALGASRWRLARMLLAEAALVSIAAAIVALGASGVFYHALFDIVPADYRIFMPAALDVRAVTVGTLATLFVTAVFAVITTLQAARTDLRLALNAGGRAHRGGTLTGRMGRVILAGQAALSLAVVVGAVFMVASFERLSRADLGFDPDGLSMSTLITFVPEESTAAREAKYLRLEYLIGHTPGLEVGMIEVVPWERSVGRAISADRSIGAGLYSTTLSFFPVVGARLIDGRWPTADEWSSHVPVAVVSRTAAARLWPGRTAVGQIHQPPRAPAYQIVGVVEDLRAYRGGPAASAMYVPYDFSNPMAPEFVMRSPLPLDGLRAVLTGAVRAVEPALLTAPTPSSVSDSLDPYLRLPRLLAGIFAVFAAAVLLVSVVGIVGLLLYLVQQRRYEIGVRMALGADDGAIRRLVIARVLGPTLAGIGVGLAGAWWGVRFIEAQLFEMRAHDPRVFVTAAAVLVTIALAAAYVPARRAGRTDPAAVLRAQ